MAEEITTGSTVADLDPTWPDGADQVKTSDNAHRNMRKAIQQTFPNVSATVSSNAAELNFAHSGGTVSGNVVISGETRVKSLETSATMSCAVLQAGNLVLFRLTPSTGNVSFITGPGLPAMTATVSGTGVYKITHNLGFVGISDYVMIATPAGETNQKVVTHQTLAATTTKLRVTNLSGSPIASGLHCLLTW